MPDSNDAPIIQRQKNTLNKKILLVLIPLIILLVVVGMLYNYSNSTNTATINNNLTEVQGIISNSGTNQTTVTANNSKITIPAGFAKKTEKINNDGPVYLQASYDTSRSSIFDSQTTIALTVQKKDSIISEVSAYQVRFLNPNIYKPAKFDWIPPNSVVFESIQTKYEATLITPHQDNYIILSMTANAQNKSSAQKLLSEMAKNLK